MERMLILPINTYVGRFTTNSLGEFTGEVVATTREAVYTDEDVKYEDKHFVEFNLPEYSRHLFIRVQKKELRIEYR